MVPEWEAWAVWVVWEASKLVGRGSRVYSGVPHATVLFEDLVVGEYLYLLRIRTPLTPSILLHTS